MQHNFTNLTFLENWAEGKNVWIFMVFAGNMHNIVAFEDYCKSMQINKC